MRKFVSWRRVSTKSQGRSGLGLAAQKTIIDYFVSLEGGEVVADYEEVYTGTDLERCLELRKAIARAKKEDATLIIAKTDRFRTVVEALTIYEDMGDGNIFFCDLPHSDKFTLTLFFALAEREAMITSIRTRQALAEKKKQGFKLGNGGKTVKIAQKASCEAKKERARTNPNNLLFAQLYQTYRLGFDDITPSTCGKFVELLRSWGAKTSSGLEFNEKRCWSMYASLKRQGIV